MVQMMSTICFKSIIHSTVKLLEEHNYYGLNRENVTIMKQNGVPAICNTECEIATKEDGHMIMKPHGHGDIHLLMSQVSNSFIPPPSSIIYLRNGKLWVFVISSSSKIQMVFRFMVSVLY